MKTETLIIGGGLSGLSLASRMAAEGRDGLLVEARERLGGRILSDRVGAARFDMGPAWFWPGQPRMAALIQTLGVAHFDQFADGDLCVEDEEGQVQRARGFAAMQGSYRVQGGLATLIDGMARTLDPARVLLNRPVVALTQTGSAVEATTRTGAVIAADRCVLALPPRVAAELVFAPSLPEATVRAMTGIATWMAGQAKAVAVYNRPFWREAGLSGDGTSRRGPMVEIHDASPGDGGYFALFGFVGVPPQARQDTQGLRQQIVAQLGRMFGPDAAQPKALLLKDWAQDPFTATRLDWAPLYAHPAYGMPMAMTDLWGGRLLFAGTEVALQWGGYLEGALEAAENALDLLRQPPVMVP